MEETKQPAMQVPIAGFKVSLSSNQWAALWKATDDFSLPLIASAVRNAIIADPLLYKVDGK